MSSNKIPTIGFIGAGNMGGMIIKGLCQGPYQDHRENIIFHNPTPSKRAALAEAYGITPCANNSEVYENADVVVFAVKPQYFQQAMAEVGKATLKRHKPLILSIMAGVSIDKIADKIESDRIVRIMPNTAAALGLSMTTLTAQDRLSEEDCQMAELVFRGIGEILWVPEKDLDITSTLNGAGPAFIYVLAEALADGAVKCGLRRDVAEALIAKTIEGAGAMLAQEGANPAILKNQVTSPGGMTIAGVAAMEEGSVRGTMIKAVEKTVKRSRDLGKEA